MLLLRWGRSLRRRSTSEVEELDKRKRVVVFAQWPVALIRRDSVQIDDAHHDELRANVPARRAEPEQFAHVLRVDDDGRAGWTEPAEVGAGDERVGQLPTAPCGDEIRLAVLSQCSATSRTWARIALERFVDALARLGDVDFR